MPELTVLIDHSPDAPPQTVATTAVNRMEQLASGPRSQSPYWDVMAATKAVPTLQAFIDQSLDREPDSDDERLLAYAVDTAESEQLIQQSLTETQRDLRSAIQKLNDVISDITETNGRDDDGGRLSTIAGNEALAEAFIDNDVAHQAMDLLTSQFGNAYRLFDLTQTRYAQPIRTTTDIDNLTETYQGKPEQLYAVRLIARD